MENNTTPQQYPQISKITFINSKKANSYEKDALYKTDRINIMSKHLDNHIQLIKDYKTIVDTVTALEPSLFMLSLDEAMQAVKNVFMDVYGAMRIDITMKTTTEGNVYCNGLYVWVKFCSTLKPYRD